MTRIHTHRAGNGGDARVIRSAQASTKGAHRHTGGSGSHASIRSARVDRGIVQRMTKTHPGHGAAGKADT